MIRGKTLAFLVLFYIPQAQAHESNKSNFRTIKELTNDGTEVAVIVREDGHLLGQPYQVELRVNCSKSKDALDLWPIQDSFSVCDLDPNSVKLNRQRDVIALKTKLSDFRNFNDQIELGISSPKAQCSKQTTIKKFQLKRLCH